MICGDILHLSGAIVNGRECSFVCMLEAGHDGPHRDEFGHEGKSIIITWRDAGEDTMPIANSRHTLLVRQIETPIPGII